MRQELSSLAWIPIVVCSESQVLATPIPMGSIVPVPFFGGGNFSTADAEKNWSQLSVKNHTFLWGWCPGMCCFFSAVHSELGWGRLCFLTWDTWEKAKRAFEGFHISLRICLDHLSTDWLRRKFLSKETAGQAQICPRCRLGTHGGAWNKREDKSKSS